MKRLSFLFICSLFFVKENPPDTPPQRFISIQYNGPATSRPHQTFIVIGEMKYETKYYWLKNHDMGPEVIKTFSKEIIEKTWNSVFHTVIVDEACFNAIENFVKENPKYLVKPETPALFTRVFTIEYKEYRVDYDRNRWLFADLVVYLKKLHCDPDAIDEMKWYVDVGD